VQFPYNRQKEKIYLMCLCCPFSKKKEIKSIVDIQLLFVNNLYNNLEVKFARCVHIVHYNIKKTDFTFHRKYTQESSCCKNATSVRIL
jgi:hypothetical protein